MRRVGDFFLWGSPREVCPPFLPPPVGLLWKHFWKHTSFWNSLAWLEILNIPLPSRWRSTMASQIDITTAVCGLRFMPTDLAWVMSGVTPDRAFCSESGFKTRFLKSFWQKLAAFSAVALWVPKALLGPYPADFFLIGCDAGSANKSLFFVPERGQDVLWKDNASRQFWQEMHKGLVEYPATFMRQCSERRPELMAMQHYLVFHSYWSPSLCACLASMRGPLVELVLLIVLCVSLAGVETAQGGFRCNLFAKGSCSEGFAQWLCPLSGGQAAKTSFSEPDNLQLSTHVPFTGNCTYCQSASFTRTVARWMQPLDPKVWRSLQDIRVSLQSYLSAYLGRFCLI